jgi:autotransporter-associated beta strand protein
MNYGADGNDYFQFTNPSMAFDKASGFTTLITFGIHVNADGTLMIGGSACASNGVYVGPSNWGSLVTTLKTPPTTVTRYEVLIGGWMDTSYDNIKSLINSQGAGPGSILYQNFQALKNAVPGIDAINDDDEQTYDLNSSTNFANMLGGLGYQFTLVPYTFQSFWVNLKRNLTNCDYVYLQCYEGGAGNDPGNWNAAFGGSGGFSISGFHVVPGQESNTANTNQWINWYLETGGRGGFYYPDVVFNTTNWSAAVLNGVGQAPLITLTNSDGGGSSSFNTPGNWSNGQNVASSNAYVDSDFTLNTPASGSPTFGGNSLLINNGAVFMLNNDGNVTTIGSNAATGLTLDYGASVRIGNSGAADTLAGYVNLGPDGVANFVSSNGTLKVSAVIGGSGSLNLPAGNSGTVIFSAANNYTGNTTVNGGSTLQLQNINSLAVNLLTLNNGSTLQLRSDAGVTFAGGNTLQGLGHATITFDADQLTGAGSGQVLGFAPGGFNVGDSTLAFTGGHGYSLMLGPLTAGYADPLTLNPTTANVSIAGILGGASITQLNKNGAGTATLTGSSTYTGGTVVNAGTLIFGAGAVGASSSLQVANGAVCQILTIQPVLAGTASVSLSSGSQLYLANGQNLAVSNLTLNGVLQPAGTWGSSSSSATNHNDACFSGSGILWVGVAPPIAGVPSGLNAMPGNAQVALNWVSASGATSYNVKRSQTNGGPYTTVANISATANNYVDSGLANGTNYYYVLSSVNSSGESANSAQASAMPEPVVTLTSGDSAGSSSFASAGHWSNGQAPSSTNNYLVSGATTLRTPNSGGSISFLGNSLTISNSNNGAFAFKAVSGSTITIGSAPASGLFLDNGLVSIFDSGRTESLAGFVNLRAGGARFTPNTGTMPITAQINGPGFLKVVGNANPAVPQNGTVILSGANSYTGGTILDTANTIQLSGTGTLGAITGPITFTDSSNLLSQQTLDLHGTSQGIGNLAGVSTGRIINNASSTTSTLTIGNGDAGGGTFLGTIADAAGVMALTKVGAGQITLAGNNSYSGPTLISGGTLSANGSISNSAVSVGSGATLGGNGTFGAPVTINSGGNLAPSPGIGMLTFNSNLTLNGNVAIELNKSAAPSNDVLEVNGILTNGGAGLVMVTNLGPALAGGDTFKLFSQPVLNGDALTLVAPAPGLNLSWKNNLAVDGTIRVVSTIPSNLALQPAGSALALSWPADHTGWRLQMQTNLLQTNWADVPGATGTNQINLTPPETGSVFYRLIYP